MKTLIVYYSRTGTTRKAAEEISRLMDSDIEEIVDLKDRKGIIGYLGAGKDASHKNLTRIRPIDHKPSKYDLILIGTPIWSWTLTPAIRSYLHQNREFFKGKKVAFFCTMGGSGYQKVFGQMHELLGIKPEATVAFRSRDVKKDHHHAQMKGFVDEIAALLAREQKLRPKLTH